MKRILCTLVASVVAAALVVAPARAQTARYAITDIGNLGYANGGIRALSDDGTAVGSGYVTNGTSGQAFSWKNGTFTNLGALISTTVDSQAVAINSQGNIVVTKFVGGVTNTLYYNASAGTFTNIASSTLNTTGACIGPDNSIYGTDYANAGFRWNGGSMYSVSGRPMSVNKYGDTADLWAGMHQSGTAYSTPVPTGVQAISTTLSCCGINALGDVVGQFGTTNGSNLGYLYKVTLSNSSTGSAIALPSLSGASYTRTYGINDHRQIVGTSNGHGVLWTVSAKGIEIEDLNDLIPANSGYTILTAAAINNYGWIACEATLSGGGYRNMVILKPN